MGNQASSPTSEVGGRSVGGTPETGSVGEISSPSWAFAPEGKIPPTVRKNGSSSSKRKRLLHTPGNSQSLPSTPTSEKVSREKRPSQGASSLSMSPPSESYLVVMIDSDDDDNGASAPPQGTSLPHSSTTSTTGSLPEEGSNLPTTARKIPKNSSLSRRRVPPPLRKPQVNNELVLGRNQYAPSTASDELAFDISHAPLAKKVKQTLWPSTERETPDFYRIDDPFGIGAGTDTDCGQSFFLSNIGRKSGETDHLVSRSLPDTDENGLSKVGMDTGTPEKGIVHSRVIENRGQDNLTKSKLILSTNLGAKEISDDGELDSGPVVSNPNEAVAEEATASDTKATYANSTAKQSTDNNHVSEALRKENNRKSMETKKPSTDDDCPTITLPRDLVPFNRPGRCDYAIVLGSRLRNRNKSDVDDDIPYFHVAGQRRCKAILDDDGKPLPEGRSGMPCANCAVGMSDYCHCHRKLDEDLSNEDSNVEELKRNDVNRCVALTSGRGRKRRCARKVKNGRFCYAHTALESELKGGHDVEKFDGVNKCGIGCIALTDGQCCTYRAVPRTVFCPMHMHLPPSECVPIDLRSDVADRVNDEKSNGEPSWTKDFRIVDSPSKELSLGDVPMTAQCMHTNFYGDRCCFEVWKGTGFCRKHSRKSEAPLSSHTLKVKQASSRDYRCVFVQNSDQCRNHVLPGSVVCPLHWDFHQRKKSMFDIKSSEQEVDSSSVSSSPDNRDISSRATDSEEEINTDTEIETQESSDEIESRDSISSSQSQPSGPDGMYTQSEFMHLWRRAEDFIGQNTEEIERSKRVRSANYRMDPNDTEGQYKAQYGRLLPNAMKKMMKITELRREDVFLDIGHGIGNTCLHASFCVGCEARGIEVVAGRHSIAEVFRSQLTMYNNEHPTPAEIGKIDLRLGQLEDPKNKDFLTIGVTRAYVNNFNGVFADRSTKNGQKWFLDDYVAGLFALMSPGTIMITFHPLSLGLDRNVANELRKKHGMNESENASFFVFEKVFLGKAYKTVKWNQLSGNQSEIHVYKYRRLEQSRGENAVFLCSNPECENAINEVPIQAAIQNDEGRYVMNHCICKFSPKNLRRRSGQAIVCDTVGSEVEE